MTTNDSGFLLDSAQFAESQKIDSFEASMEPLAVVESSMEPLAVVEASMSPSVAAEVSMEPFAVVALEACRMAAFLVAV